MPDLDLIEDLSSGSRTLHIWHNAHHESRTTVARHLLHRERIGERIVFSSQEARRQCVDNDMLWEITLRAPDEALVHFGGASLGDCLLLAQASIGAHPASAAVA